jgi:hypothetical protein
MADHVLDILLPAGKEVVNANDIVPIRQQPIAKMRAQEAGSAGHKDELPIVHDAPQADAD